MPLPALYTAEVTDLDDYWVSDLIWATPRRVVVVTIDELVFSDSVPAIQLSALVLTRRSGGPWYVPDPGGSPIITGGGADGGNSLVGRSLSFTVLDEMLVVVQAVTVAEASTVAKTAAVPDPSVPGASWAMSGPLPGGFSNLFGIQAEDSGAPNLALSCQLIDDPDRDGHFLVDMTLGTDGDGVVTSSLDGFGYALEATGGAFGSAEVGSPTSPLVGGFSYLPCSGGVSGGPPPLSLRVTVA